MLGYFKKRVFKKFRESEIRFHELNYLFWECTARCNLNCIHCGSDCSKSSLLPDMPAEDFLRALDTIKNPPKNFTVVFTGGEPLLRNDIERCGIEIRKRGLRWSMVSNGYLYNMERHVSLLNAGMGALTISLDGLEESHSWLRNSKSSFKRVVDAINLAASSNRLNFDVVTCVNQRNFHELLSIKSLLKSVGVKAWRIFTIVPIGRAQANPELILTDLQFLELMNFIAEARRDKSIEVKFSCEGFVGKFEGKVRDVFFFCRAGINIASVLIDGSISACPNIDRGFVQGNIYTDNLFEVWQNKFQPFRNRSWACRGICQNCSHFVDCQGNGFHNWHGDLQSVLVCHNQKIENAMVAQKNHD